MRTALQWSMVVIFALVLVSAAMLVSNTDCVGSITQCHSELPAPGSYQLGPVGSDTWPLTK